MPLFVQLAPGLVLDNALIRRVRTTLRQQYTSNHVPDKIYQVPAIPMTLTGKKMEVPIRRILMGADPAKAINRHAMAKPEALTWFLDYARNQTDYRL
jgi:acetoacetyl-CoA synthetase